MLVAVERRRSPLTAFIAAVIERWLGSSKVPDRRSGSAAPRRSFKLARLAALRVRLRNSPRLIVAAGLRVFRRFRANEMSSWIALREELDVIWRS